MEKGPENTPERTFNGVSLREIYEVIHLLPTREFLPSDILEANFNEWRRVENLSKIGLKVKWEKREVEDEEGRRVIERIPHLEITDEQELHEFFSWLFEEILRKPINAEEMDIAARVYRVLFSTFQRELAENYGSFYFEEQFQLYTFFSEHIIEYLHKGQDIFAKRPQKEFLQKEKSEELMIQPLINLSATLFRHYENSLEREGIQEYRRLYAEFIEAVLQEKNDDVVEEKGLDFLHSLRSSNQIVQKV